MTRPRMTPVSLLACLALVLLAAVASAQSLQPVRPEQAGFDPARLGRIADTIKAEIEKGKMPGAVN